MTLKDLHDHLSKMLADGVSPETPVARWNRDGWDLAEPDDAILRLGRAISCDDSVWFFEDDILSGIAAKGDERTVLYL